MTGTPWRLLQAGLLVAWTCLPGCGDAASDPRGQCSATHRLVVAGSVGPTHLDVNRNDPFTGGRTGDTFLTLVLQGGDAPHLIGFTSNTALDVDLWSALLARLQGGAADANQLTLATRPSDVPCDPREGVLCASFGVDTNGDGILFGANEVIYPIESGELHVTEVSGNAFNGDFAITFGAATSGDESGSDRGGTLHGCFRLFRMSDRETLF
jgi:hypothetical protein